MPTGTTYNPPNVNSLIKTALLFDGQGVSGTAAAGTTTNFDLAVTDDQLITGLWFWSIGGNPGDTVSIQLLSGGTVVDTFVTWPVPPNVNEQFDIVYPAKIVAGLTIRTAYLSTGTSSVYIGSCYKLHKVLV